MIKKDFQKWHLLKSKIEKEQVSPLFHSREVWWCSLGVNIGIEADGRNESLERPVLIFRKFNQEMFWAIPLTSKKKTGRFYCGFTIHDTQQTAILSQMRVLSGKRLIRRIGRVSHKQFKRLYESLVNLIKETDSPYGESSGA